MGRWHIALNCCETGGGGAAACLERRARSADCTLAAEAAAVAAAAAAQDQDPDQIKSAAATAAATTSAVVMFKTSRHCRRHSSSTGSGSGRSYCTRFLRFHTRIHNHNRSLLPLHHSLLVPPSSMFDYTASYDPQLARVSMFCKNFRKFFLVRAVFCSIIGAFSGSL